METKVAILIKSQQQQQQQQQQHSTMGKEYELAYQRIENSLEDVCGSGGLNALYKGLLLLLLFIFLMFLLLLSLFLFLLTFQFYCCRYLFLSTFPF